MFANAVALFTIGVALLVKIVYWHLIGSSPAMSTPQCATGLGSIGKVRLFEEPHTSENYLLKEMDFRVARRHAQKLRRFSVLLGFVLPFLLTAITPAIGCGRGDLFAAQDGGRAGRRAHRTVAVLRGSHVYGDPVLRAQPRRALSCFDI
jgi:hypothetical protein